MKDELIKQGVLLILKGLEVDLGDRNFLETPDRVLRVYKELFGQPRTEVRVFEEEHDEMVTLRNHRTWGLCPHHLLPVEYNISACYIPTDRVVGLSKIARIIDDANAGPCLQESIAPGIVDRLMLSAGALGAGCVVAGRHGCMRMRGVKTSGDVITSAVRGALKDKAEARAEFLALVRSEPWN